MVTFIKDTYQKYWEMYIGDENHPPLDPGGYDPEAIYYLKDEDTGHQHIFMNGKEYAVTPVVYGQESAPLAPPTLLLKQEDYDAIKAAQQIDENTLYLIYEESIVP